MPLKDILDYGCLGFLGFLSIIVVSLILERLYIYRKIDVASYDEKKALEIDLTNNLTLIATIGSNAPYVGLLGTVGGIMLTFIEIGNNDMVNTGAIMTGLALALKATAMGLIVAIPAIVSYNLLLRKSEVLLLKWDLIHQNNDYMI
ncbi:TonB-system energizer ExbB [Helicobacter sp. MIT 99-5507]|uniref:TonB-system energizer ExbB n=1 Tax=Helicobacter sp. MIT 99-5507 TaxID=152489 RepID=UPI000E1F87F2|nr:TonB-system energizer ExbB [Helicobacter sp. MIT 99-5507]RDU58649.1 TonB-system energizer ExbB [Helicobacter sp. MIT 99-5507]